MLNGYPCTMKNHPLRLQQLRQNPVTLALFAQHHRTTLTNTRIADQLALQAVEAGTANAGDVTRLRYLAEMLLSLACAGFGFAGITTADLQALCRAAVALLDAGHCAPDTELQSPVNDGAASNGIHCAPGPVWRRLDAMHQVQLDACSPTQYLRARCSLM